MNFLTEKERPVDSSKIEIEAVHKLMSGEISPQVYARVVNRYATSHTVMFVGMIRHEEKMKAVDQAPAILKPLVRRIPLVFF